MPDKDSLVIQPSGEVISHTALQSDLIVFDEEKRQKFIQILRQIPAILDIAKKLSEGKTYKAYIAPEIWERINEGSAKLDDKGNGLFGVLIRDVETGHITDHVSLKEVTPDLLSSLNQLATQQTLANMGRLLEVMDEKITDVLQGQINDRLAEIESGIDIYEHAVADFDLDFRRQLMGIAIGQLSKGRNELIKSTDFSFLDKLPRNRRDMFFSLNPNYWDIPKYVQSKAKPVWEAYHAIVKASYYLILAYSALNHPGSLQVSLEQVKSKVNVFEDKMEEIVRWLPPTSNWRESLTTISQGFLQNIRDLDDIPQKTIVVEFQPKEIAPPKEFDHETLQR